MDPELRPLRKDEHYHLQRPMPAQSAPSNPSDPAYFSEDEKHVKPRLTNEQHQILEDYFKQQYKPTTGGKKILADQLGVPLDKINNWFQNRRAKAKQDRKKLKMQYDWRWPSLQTAQPGEEILASEPLHSTTPSTNGLETNSDLYVSGTFQIEARSPDDGTTSLKQGPRRYASLPHPMFAWLRKLVRPNVKGGYRRIEWQCDCGADLYADLPYSYGGYIDELLASLQGPGLVSNPASGSSASPDLAGAINTGLSETNPQAPSLAASGKAPPSAEVQSNGDAARSALIKNDKATAIETSELHTSQRFLALCVNTGGIYRTLAEIDMSNIASDSQLFMEMKSQYHSKRGRWSRFAWLIKPITVEFIEFKFWNFKQSYISICKRPDCIPPSTSTDYDFHPRELKPPPMPPEVFIHYLEHGDGDLNPTRNDWIGHLPKRLKKHEPDCYAYGMHVIEGPHKFGIFLVTTAVVVVGVLISITWSVVTKDVQGGTGIGALFIACYTAFLTAWIFWRSGT